MPPRELTGPAGRLEALLEEPKAAGTIEHDGRISPGHPGGLRAAVVFAHPLTSQGGTMHTKVVYQAAKALSRIGCAVLRFNFRGAGASAGTFDNGPGEQQDFRAALDYMASTYPGAPLWAAGMSFGSWVALSVGAEDPRVSALLGIAHKHEIDLIVMGSHGRSGIARAVLGSKTEQLIRKADIPVLIAAHPAPSKAP